MAGDTRIRARRMAAFICKLAIVLSGLTFAGVHGIATATPAKAFTVPSAVTDVNPNSIKSPCPGCSPDLFGGRTEAYAVNPINSQIVFAATEYGGIWKSTDHGSSWTHVDAVPLTSSSDVKFASSDANIVIATGAYDGSIDNRGGGIWRSSDGGTTWSQPATANVCATVSANNAHKMSIVPGTPGSLKIFVATDCGLAQSSDSGATWTLNANLPAGTGYLDVKAIPVSSSQLNIDVCGVGFHDYYAASKDGGVTWPIQDSTVIDNTSGSSYYFSAPNACSLATAPQEPNTVFYTALGKNPESNSPIKEADDDGAANASWHDLNVSKDGNGRPSWVITAPGFDGVTTDFEVFYGTNSIVMHQTCSTLNTPRCADGTNAATSSPSNSGSWSVYDGSIRSVHNSTDPATLGFDPNTGCPFLEGGDPGVFSTTNGCNSSPTFTPSNTGQHALDSYMMSGTALTGPTHTDLYSVMQDNGLVWSTDGGTTWGTDQGGGSFVPDGFQTFSDRTGPPSSVLYLGNSTYTRATSDDVFSTLSFTPPTGSPQGASQFGYESYGFIVSDGASTPTYTVQVTTDAGSTWHQMGPALPGGPAGLPTGQQPIVASGTASSPVFYLNLKVNNTPTIYRLQGPMSTSATLTSASNGLSNPSVFNVNPTNPLDLYAVDTAGAGAAKFSTDGGQTWQTDSTLTNLVTAGNVYAFNNSAGGDISSFGFAASGSTILAGTNFTGIYASFDGGAHWAQLSGSTQLSRVTSFFFDANNPGTAYASSYGRGIWKIHLPQADLSITKTHTPDPVIAGTNLTWTITVTNNGPDPAPGVVVTDTLPAQLTYLTNNLNPPAGCTATGQTVTCNVGDLDVGASVTFNLVTFVKPDTVANAGGTTSITNTATVGSAAVQDTNPANNTAQDTATVTDSADLAVSKLCKPDNTTIYPREPINCSVFTDNLGPSYARNVVVDDTTLSDGTFTITNIDVNNNGADLGPAVCTESTVAGGQKLSCAVGNLANASTTQTGRVTVSYTVTATGTSANGQSLDDTASARSDTPDPNPENDSATVNLAVTALGDESLAKSGPATVVAGTPISWTLTAHNDGPSDAANTSITDTVPAGVTITSVSMPGASCVTGVAGDPNQPAVCNLGTLAVNTSSSVMTVSATVNPQTTGTLQNNARVSSSTYDGNLSNNLATTSTTVTVTSSIAVAIAATPNPVTAGTALSYQLTVSNGGPSTATAVTLSDPLPSGVTFISTGGVGTCGFQTNTATVTCSLPNLDPGQSEVVYIYTTVKASTLPQNMTDTATATANGSPNGPGSVTTQVATSADLGIVLTSDASLYKPSSTIHYTITVTNAGPSDAQNVVITDNLPAVKQGKYVSNSFGCPPPSGTTLTCSYTVVPALVTIPAGGSITFQVNFFITGNKGTVTSTASVISATPDPNTSNNTSTRNVTVHK